VKRSRKIRLVLLGSVSLGALAAAAGASAGEPPVNPNNVYANDYFLPGVGHYHAPFRAFYPQPYNFYDPARKLFFAGGQWLPAPHRSIVNLSTPTSDAVRAAEGMRTDLPRGGFGSTSTHHSIIT
jgi:hypothetical protein